MSYSSLPLTSKLFQLTFLTCALALAGCGGGDGTDVIAPTPDLGPEKPDSGSGEDGTGMPVSAINVTDIVLTDPNGNITRTITSAGVSATVNICSNR